MKQLLFFLCFVISPLVFSQEATKSSYVDVNYFRGNIALHNNYILHLIEGHPEGVVVSWNRKTFGNKEWEGIYNYPDYGASFSYQNLKNEVLGDNYALYGHYNFYFLKRNVMLRIGTGLAYNTNPYDKYDNYKNVAFGSTILSATYLMLNYKRERIFDRFGLQAGLSLFHYSNANVVAPNTSVNTVTFNVGVTYDLEEEDPEFIHSSVSENFTQPIKFNIVFRTGVNESDIIGMGQSPFYVISAYADKRLSRKSGLQLGADMFFSTFLKDLIAYNSVAFPERNIDPDTDYKRVGMFVGYELYINKMSVETQVGYYVYYPYDFEGRTYFRIGLKRYFGKKMFGAITLKTHGAKAECVEFGVGIRL
ncbi:acyloxyacyl hydrolase [Formosa sp. PL04]|uniref:acyloxyacyl hydrolase n=1 Tax=Formosa sp. PL04 TaxID=3081755 RepID=UPI002981C086|nr:acyloxyacyl hydrolase [Formosa sp. PL04]MDW5287461.1 acyloxyacyl hydrolase [Formosa sp. PL04]